MLIAVNFHYVRPAFDLPYPGIHGITPAQMQAQLEALATIGTFVSADEIARAIRGDASLPERSLVVTLDDGLHEQHQHAAPVLQRLGIPAIYFVNTEPLANGRVSSVHKTHLLRANVAPADFADALLASAARQGVEIDMQFDTALATNHYKYDEPEIARLKYLLNFVLAGETRDELIETMFQQVFGEREAAISEELYMSREQVRELSERGEIGTHGHEHLPLGLLPAAEIERQLDESLRLLGEWTGRRPSVLSYPYGSREASSPQAASLAAERGIEFAFTMERAANSHLENPLHLARFDNNDLPGGKAARWTLDTLFAQAPQRSWFLDPQEVARL